MFKRILTFVLCCIMVLGMTACGEKDPSTDKGNESEASVDESVETSDDASADTSDDVSGDVSGDTSEDGQYVDQEGYEQFLKVSKLDKTLKNRGFKDKGANSDYVPLNYDKMKAMWISQYDFEKVYNSGSKQRSESSFKKSVEKAYDNLLTLGFNTVIVQVRPNGDSFYPSAYYPTSSYVMGSYGKYLSYDPIKIMVDLAHEKGISFHAWINPMRAMSSSNLSKVNAAYPMSSWTQVANKVKCKGFIYDYNNLYYLNPAYEDVRNLIINGAAEIVRYYNVDGVHMDDYFYWGEEKSFDSLAYAEAKKTNKNLSLQQFRYDNLNKLVSGIYSAIKAENKNVMFGISPAGNLDKMADTYYADVRTWLSKKGYVDYIMPQIYFGMEHQTWGFAYTYQRWAEIVKNPDIKIMTGISLGKAKMAYEENAGDQYAGTGKNEWIENRDVVKKCLQYASSQSDFSGYAFFCYQYFFDPVSGKALTSTAEEVRNAKSYLTSIIKGEPIKY